MPYYNEIQHYKALVEGCKRTIIMQKASFWDAEHKVKFFKKKLKKYEKKLKQLQDDYGNEMYDKLVGN